ncbi:MAG: nucleotidyl transferase AbiEii/AbiGii toxin family protein [Geminicoccaceae bacterium]
MRLHLDILETPQRLFWSQLGPRVPPRFVLYGGTAIALRLGHRRSVDFDFFTDRPLGPEELERRLPSLARAKTLQRSPRTLILSLPIGGADVKLSFFAGIGIGRVGDPERAGNRVLIASPLDLLATKLKALHDRVEAKDYLDIEALLRSGLDLSKGIMAARTLFGESLNPLDTAKAVGWFKDGDLEVLLPAKTRSFLGRASGRFDPGEPAVPRRSASLALAERNSVKTMDETQER